MIPDKHIQVLKETLDEIAVALDDGLKKHQRRLAIMISIGIAELFEIYLHKKEIIKPGARIKHDWLKRKNAKEKIEQQCINRIGSELDNILEIAKEIELERNDMAYGSPVDDEKLLKRNIERFFQIKDSVEELIGEKIVKD